MILTPDELQSQIYKNHIEQRMRQGTTLAFESKTYLAQLNLPFLVINGSKDVQVPALSNQEGFKKSMSAATLKLSSFELIEGANHLFQQCERCSLTEYASLEQTLDPVLMQHVTSWILEQQQAHR